MYVCFSKRCFSDAIAKIYAWRKKILYHNATLYLLTLLDGKYRGSLFKYDNSISFWNFCAAGNYAGRFYKFAMKDVEALQEKLMMDSMAMLQSAEAK